MGTIRKQVCISPDAHERLRRLATVWACTEAEVIRRAIDGLPDLRSYAPGSIEERLAATAQLIQYHEDAPMTSEELDALERAHEAWVDALPEPLGLAQAVIEDRR